MLAILDYGAGNQTSVRRALDLLGIPCRITADSGDLERSAGIIFPGVGASGQAMHRLQTTGLDTVLKKHIAHGKPLLGICLGCQIMLEYSEENQTETLGILPGKCVRFSENLQDQGVPVRIPHMGWNTLHFRRESPLFAGVDPESSYYFVHSYYTKPAEDLIIAECTYGLDFCAAFGRDGLWAVQFHPEKSGRPGLKILQNFYDWCVKQNVCAENGAVLC
ncbi:MAG: imidazole glycerol phosphate synthase subunit HisH [Desulfovibrionaceae bacterium]|nr:imidazole glycerol phosphate synthase subunit HisH [Desulfovibrionaceae bacterium]